jgi:hypothetical protein
MGKGGVKNDQKLRDVIHGRPQKGNNKCVEDVMFREYIVNAEQQMTKDYCFESFKPFLDSKVRYP